MKIIGYRDETNPQPVTELTPAQEERRAELSTLSKEVHDVRNNLQLLELRRAVLRKTCDHPVFTDQEGFPYDHRHCVVCGASMGQL